MNEDPHRSLVDCLPYVDLHQLLHRKSIISNRTPALLSFSLILSNIETMSNTSPVLLILGSGPNVGQKVSQAFAAKGYKIALASRRIKEVDSTANQVNISSDLSDPDSVIRVFQKVQALLGPPSVVVYNGKNEL